MRPKDGDRLGGKVTRRRFIQKGLVAGAAISASWLWSGGASWAAGTPALEVRRIFDDAVKAFNNQKPDALESLLDPAVTLLKIHPDHPHAKISGSRAVIGYLSNAWNGPNPVKMIFNPDYNDATPTIKLSGPNDSSATVTGLACWQDYDESPSDRDGELKYKFELSKSSGSWLITKLSGWYTTNPPTRCS